MPSPNELRSAIASLGLLAEGDLDALLDMVTSAADARTALMDILPALIASYGDAAAAIAADWYDESRDEAGVAKRFTAIPADSVDRGAESLAGWSTEPWIGAPVDEVDWGDVRRRLYGGVHRRISDAARETVMHSAVEDPSSDGWQRVARPNACPFCKLLASRGAVYTERTADFGAHDGKCYCVAVSAWKGEERPVKPYSPTDRKITDADRARVKAWIADNL